MTRPDGLISKAFGASKDGGAAVLSGRSLSAGDPPPLDTPIESARCAPLPESMPSFYPVLIGAQAAQKPSELIKPRGRPIIAEADLLAAHGEASANTDNLSHVLPKRYWLSPPHHRIGKRRSWLS